MLAVLQIGGGNDGLNAVIPYADGAYYDARPGLAIAPEDALILDDQFALHPSFGGVQTLDERGDAAIVLGAGYPNPSRSHFTSMDIWHTGSTDGLGETGWVGTAVGRDASPAGLALARSERGCIGAAFAGEHGLVRAVAEFGTGVRAADRSAAPGGGPPPREATRWARATGRPKDDRMFSPARPAAETSTRKGSRPPRLPSYEVLHAGHGGRFAFP